MIENVTKVAKTFLDEKPRLEVYREVADQTVKESVKAIQERMQKELKQKQEAMIGISL